MEWNFKNIRELFFQKSANFLLSMKENSKIPVLDIGSFQFKLIRGHKNDKGEMDIPLLVKRDSPRHLVLSSILPRLFMDSQEVSENLRSLRAEFLGEESYVRLVLPDHALQTHILRVPSLVFKENPTAAIKKELTLILPFPLKGYHITYQPLAITDVFTTVLVNTCLMDNLQEITLCLRSAGLFPVAIRSASLNALNYFSPYLKDEEYFDQNIAVVHLAHESTSVSIIKSGTIQYFQHLGIGGDMFVNDLARNLHVGLPEATTIKHQERIFLPEYGEEQEKVPLFQFIKTTTLNLLQEIYKCFERYLARRRKENIKSILLFGGGANFQNLPFLIEANLQTPVVLAGDLFPLLHQGKAVEKEEANSLYPALGF